MAKIISITGDLGSGKSTVSGILCKRLSYEYIYTGKIQREIAGKRGMTTLELNKYAETHPEIDEEIDSTFKSLNESANLIVDSRLAWFFIPESFKVFLKTSLIVSANRISGDTLRENEKYSSREDAVNKIIARKASENKRYMELYHANCSDLSHFSLIVDTSFIAPERVANIIYTEYNIWLASGGRSKSFISPENLYPIRSVSGVGGEYFENVQNNMKVNGYDLNLPVTAVSINGFDYILDGHKRAASAIRNNIELIPVVYKSEADCSADMLTRGGGNIDSAEQNQFHEWEEFNSFNYLIYPF